MSANETRAFNENANPARDAFAITGSDSVDFTQGVVKSIYVGGAGIVAVVTPRGSVVNFTVPAGGYIYCAAKRVNLTNTTATLMVGLLD